MTATARENDDLFWAIRGGGGHFGVVTSFEFKPHPVGTVLAGLTLHPAANARAAVSRWRDLESTAPDASTQGACCSIARRFFGARADALVGLGGDEGVDGVRAA